MTKLVPSPSKGEFKFLKAIEWLLLSQSKQQIGLGNKQQSVPVAYIIL